MERIHCDVRAPYIGKKENLASSILEVDAWLDGSADSQI